MNAPGVASLVRLLWPDGDGLKGRQVHALLDGARDERIAPLVRFGRLEYACLFGERLTPNLRAAAPYLVHLSPGAALTQEILAHGWNDHWGILASAPADVTLAQLRLHFKKFLRVRTEDGRQLQFRYYDPRVLRVFLPTCTQAEYLRFLGPLTSIVVPGADGEPLGFAKTGSPAGFPLCAGPELR